MSSCFHSVATVAHESVFPQRNWSGGVLSIFFNAHIPPSASYCRFSVEKHPETSNTCSVMVLLGKSGASSQRNIFDLSGCVCGLTCWLQMEQTFTQSKTVYSDYSWGKSVCFPLQPPVKDSMRSPSPPACLSTASMDSLLTLCTPPLSSSRPRIWRDRGSGPRREHVSVNLLCHLKSSGLKLNSADWRFS